MTDRVAPEELVEAWATLVGLQKHRHPANYHGRGILRPDACDQCARDVVRLYIGQLEGENERLRGTLERIAAADQSTMAEYEVVGTTVEWLAHIARTALSNSTKEGTDD